MEQQLLTFGVLFVSLLVGVVAAWLLLRPRIDAASIKARNESAVALATINARFGAAQEDGRNLATQCADLERHGDTLRKELSTARSELSQLTERVARVPKLDTDLDTCRSKLAQTESDLTQVKTQLAERSQILEAESRRVQELERAFKAERQRGEGLQAELRTKAEFAAGLEEQCARLPQLAEALNASQQEVRTVKQTIQDIRQELGASLSTAEAHSKRIMQLEDEQKTLTQRRDELIEKNTSLRAQIADLDSKLGAERTQSVEAREQLSVQFKALANDILEEKAKRFTDQNQMNLSALLDPFKTKLQEFGGKVDRAYDKGSQDHTALSVQVKQLMEMNQKISEDANNLTRALKGQSKAQGTWGELILERVLEASGLIKGTHYEAQESHTREDGTRAQTDVVIRLPEQKHLVVDAKVSLVAYEEYANADTDEARKVAIARHLNSVRGHIKGLSSKNYQDLYQLKSLDFVLMFVPIEPAFMLAISQDSELWQSGWRQNVLLVSPSTLLFVVRTVAHLWRQENQNRNAQDIAKRGAEFYDKLAGFVEELEELGKRLQQAQKAYDGAYSKFASGRGNVIRQAELLKELGVKPSKQMSAKALEAALEPEELESLSTTEELVENKALGLISTLKQAP